MECVQQRDNVAMVMQLLDPELRKEYDFARDLVPSLVQQETKFSDFLRAEDGDMMKAAARLANHWKVRKLLFGERWLLPMSQSGTGLLRPKDVAILRTGYFKMAQSKVHGTVFILDQSFLPTSVRQVQTEIIFYMFTVAACDVTALCVLRGTAGRPGMRLSNEIKAIVDATPTRIKAVYMAHAYEPGKECLHEFLADQQKVVAKINYRVNVQARIQSNSFAGTLRQLERFGFDQSCTPCELGGNVDNSFFDKWVGMRLSVEDLVASPNSILTGFCKVPEQSDNSSNGSLILPSRKHQRRKESLSLTRLPGESDQAFTKRRNALYVKRNYHRQKLDRIVAESEVVRLRGVNEALRQDNLRLQDLLEQARNLIDMEKLLSP